MIARLRARHARMWGALLVVVPVVLGAALSVRRGEAVRQAIPPALMSERATARPASSTWSPPYPETSKPESYFNRPVSSELLLYWSRKSTPEIDAWVDRPGASPMEWIGDPPPNGELLALHLALPEDALLLGGRPLGMEGLSPRPARSRDDEGVYVWYSLVDAAVVHAVRAQGATR